VSAESQKKAAGEAAAALVAPGMTVGLGTGSTAEWFVRALAARALGLRAVATSEATAALAASLGGFRLVDLDEAGSIDLTVDGADEIGPGLALIKGGGAALLREKLVWEASARRVVIADASKRPGAPEQQGRRFGRFPLPIEVVAFGHATTSARIDRTLAALGLAARVRLRLRDGEPVRTDGGNLIYDAPCEAIDDPAALAGALKGLTGVVEHGLFLDLAERALIGAEDGVITLLP
jgi:ribose 5-phosphate isomerase A